jgi:hypothetical protein
VELDSDGERGVKKSDLRKLQALYNKSRGVYECETTTWKVKSEESRSKHFKKAVEGTTTTRECGKRVSQNTRLCEFPIL